MIDDIDPSDLIFISDDLRVPAAELHFRFSRSSGPGGQHVNRSETRVELFWDVQGSASLNESQRARLLGRLGAYLDSSGTLHIVSSATRSQADNRSDTVARFAVLLRSALRRQKLRVPTRPSASARARRLDDKRQRSSIKQTRRGSDDGW